MKNPKSSKLKIGNRESQLEEYRFLVQNFLTRANTANNFWITGFATASGLLYVIYDKPDHKILLFSLVLLAIFNWSMAWQLEEITKLRTYMRIVLEKRLGIIWEQAWYQMDTTSKMATRSRREVVYIFIIPYLFFACTMVYTNYVKGGFISSSLKYNIAFGLSCLAYLASAYRVYLVYSAKTFKKYISYWNQINNIIDNQEDSQDAGNIDSWLYGN